ncbi:hypothetical protein [Occallatibacter riparius]|uniref:Uncharacterized protein n=1 Tax=Occallatibacter riparius TaxID=1002689 RepID=A0A9J7BR98_9BACT|nr:hypothetical protein [Occallatibacter riparius]UWZ85200.1 hypothetical protein MOP44_04475 [Occallatibacter riparius]
MSRICWPLCALMCAAPALAQTAPTPVAYVYVGSPTAGIFVYHAAADGSLSWVGGSPFQTIGLGVGSIGSYFFTLGTYNIHMYPVAANGALEKQISQLDTRGYAGSDCEPTWGRAAVLNHTGQDLYVMLMSGNCATYQSYAINKRGGTLTFIGAATNSVYYPYTGYPAITGDNQYVYIPTEWKSYLLQGTLIYGFRRESSGALANWSFTETDAPLEDGRVWTPYLIAEDPTNHVAVALAQYGLTTIRLASYTEDAQGNLSTTNTYENMPITDVFPQQINMSPDGAFLAIAGNEPNQIAFHGTAGLEIYHFNGSAPPTKYKVLTQTPIDEIHWDKSGHLYAVSNSTQQLFVYSVTAAGTNAAPGSPYKLPAPSLDSLTVVPK